MEKLLEWIWPHSARDDDIERRQEDQRRILAEHRHRMDDRDQEHRRQLGYRSWAELDAERIRSGVPRDRR